MKRGHTTYEGAEDVDGEAKKTPAANSSPRLPATRATSRTPSSNFSASSSAGEIAVDGTSGGGENGVYPPKQFKWGGLRIPGTGAGNKNKKARKG